MQLERQTYDHMHADGIKISPIVTYSRRVIEQRTRCRDYESNDRLIAIDSARSRNG